MISCKNNESKTYDHSNNSTTSSSGSSNITFNNNIKFAYEHSSTLDINSFKGLSTITDLNISYPIFSVRQNKDQYYTIYSLKDNKLCYVLFEDSQNTGVDFYIKEIIEYPFKNNDNEKLFNFLLDQDLPENITN